ncbi:amino acid ABC transporter permease [Jhaorihella thermophila]|uniref:Polar amino acid transport system permease protein n=1 Tax=Jhaorihella thermophila TaxID=488547 RepID=A0A1H5UF71_9RHOB|nr:amino acid ABC transporter permease [Jhaorihella thermophila]SEF73674.1 polar amino acid transport system permease protein [Jhaorihella thermophila]
MNSNFHWRPVLRALPDLIQAAFVTLEVAALSMLIGVVLGLALAMARDFTAPAAAPARWLAVAWVALARNTPALFQLYFFGFGLGAWGINMSPLAIVLAGLSFNNAGYLAETFRGGFRAVPAAQMRAALSLGMTRMQAMTRIVVPQVLRAVWHPLTNQMVWAVLMSSLGMLVGLHELAGETQAQASRTFRIFEYFAVAAVIYYVVVKLLVLGARLMAWRLFRGWSPA